MWIATIPYEDATDELKASYDRQTAALGEPTEMTLVGSLYPRIVAARLELYAATERCPSNLSARQRALVAFVTSALNDTVYCMSQVSIKLRETGLDNDQIASLARNPLEVDLPPADAEAVRYTVKLTTAPGSVTEEDVERLRAAGFTDLDILDINSQCAHLNYVNRVVTGLGITHAVDPEFPAFAAVPTDESPGSH